MYGAILGDIIGSPYEFDRGHKTKEFPLFTNTSAFTDDTVMTVAVADAFMSLPTNFSDEQAHCSLVEKMQSYGRKYWTAGYGNRFFRWLTSDEPKPYNSFGNGSAMRVSSVAWLFDSLEAVRRCARLSAEVTHNHPEGIKGAEATACAIFLARTGSSKKDIKDFIASQFDYDLSRTCDEIRPHYYHVESCQETVPEAITAFLEGENFEDVIRTAVSLGGDCDTLTAIAGSIAEGFYGIPSFLKCEVNRRLPQEFNDVLTEFEGIIKDRDTLNKKIRYYKKDGTFDSEVPLTVENLRGIHGMMSRLKMHDGIQLVGFADSYRAHNPSAYNGTVYDAIDLWTWSNIDETTHRLIGEGSAKFDQTWVCARISDILHIDAVLHSNPRWGGLLTNRFPDNIE